jgi:hypothetical protein
MEAPGQARSAQVVAASGFLVLSAILVFMQAVGLQASAGWPIPRDLLGTGVRVAIAVVLAWGLLRGSQWAWWGSIVVAAFWSLQGALMSLVMFGTPPSLRAFYAWPLAPLSWGFVSSLLAFVLLLLPKTRRVFR